MEVAGSMTGKIRISKSNEIITWYRQVVECHSRQLRIAVSLPAPPLDRVLDVYNVFPEVESDLICQTSIFAFERGTQWEVIEYISQRLVFLN